MAGIVKTEIQEMPEVKLIGRKYTEKDANEYGMFNTIWGEWFSEGLFDKLCAKCNGIEGISDAYIGLCRCNEGKFEYWIGILMSPNDVTPEGYTDLTLPAGKIFVAYYYGNENNGEIYGEVASNQCYDELKKQGKKPLSSNIMYERYCCPRFTTPDEHGNVILDYCIYIEN